MSSDDVAISARGVSKQYVLDHEEAHTTLGEKILSRLRRPLRRARRETFQALTDVSFDVACGEVVGIIGRNGAGKSTLLKILSRITELSAGEVRLYGRVGSLLEVGTGFHPELTGRENIYLNGAILGMTRREIRRQFEAIVDFAEIERFLDTPVKRYSSGMYVRLAFAVAAHLNPEILVVDEVLAVGDAEFQQKCLGKMGEVAGSGRTILFVSHNMAAVQQLCTRAILLRNGRVAHEGSPVECAARYLAPGTSGGVGAIVSQIRRISSKLKVLRIAVNGSTEQVLHLPADGRALDIEIEGTTSDIQRIDLELRILDDHGVKLGFFGAGLDSGFVRPVGPGHFVRRWRLALPRITQGRYHLDLDLTDPGSEYLLRLPNAVTIEAEGASTQTGCVMEYAQRGWIVLEGDVCDAHPSVACPADPQGM